MNMKYSKSAKEFLATFPIEEAELEDYDDLTNHQLTFTFPEELRQKGMGEEVSFFNNGKDTYFFMTGAEQNTPLWVVRGQLYTDMDLYRFVYNYFELLIEED